MAKFLNVKDMQDKDVMLNIDNIFCIENDDYYGDECINVTSTAGEHIYIKGGQSNWQTLINRITFKERTV